MVITLFLEAFWQLSLAMAPYILFGLLFAGILHKLVPDNIATKHLGKENVSSVVKFYSVWYTPACMFDEGETLSSSS